MKRVVRRKNETEEQYQARRAAAVREYIKTVTIKQYCYDAKTGELIDIDTLSPKRRELLSLELQCALGNGYERAHQRETGAETRGYYYIPDELRAELTEE